MITRRMRRTFEDKKKQKMFAFACERAEGREGENVNRLLPGAN